MEGEVSGNGGPDPTASTPAVPAGGDPRPAVSIPDHELLRCIGRGSYGEVWIARSSMGVFRAVKIVHRSSFKDQRPFERELSGIRRFEPVSRSYEGFVDVLHVGINTERGCFYYVMELGDDQVTGQKIEPDNYSPRTLAGEIAARGRLPFQDCLQFGLALTQALAELHKHGLVHRDIKPSNIIFVNGVPKLADIGLVADVAEARSYVGTEGFIPPEGPGTPQADVYSLGKVLYESCTGKDRQEFPALPTLLEELPDQEAFLELNEVILNACKNDINDRYRSAWEMHADLLVLANGKSVKRLKLLERRFARVKRSAGIAAAAALVIAIVGFLTYREFRSAAEKRQREVDAQVRYGTRSMEEGNLFAALPHFFEALAFDQGSAAREEPHRLRIGSLLGHSPRLIQMWAVTNRHRENDDIQTLEVSADGRHVLVNQWEGRSQVFDSATATAASPVLGFPGLVYRGAFSPDAAEVLVGCHDSKARVCRVSNGEVRLTIAHPVNVRAVDYSPDGKFLLTGCTNGLVQLLDARTGTRVLPPIELGADVRSARFSRDGKLFVTATAGGIARVWETATGKPVGRPLAHPNWVTGANFNHDNSRLITACLDHRARVWDLNTGERVGTDLVHRESVSQALYSPDGRLIVTTSLDGTARLWLADGQPLLPHPVMKQTGPVKDAKFAPDGHRVFVACADGTIKVWDLSGIGVPRRVPGDALSEDGLRFLVETNGGFQVGDTLSGRMVSPVLRSEFPIGLAVLSSDGRYVASQSDLVPTREGRQAAIELWDVASGKRLGDPLHLAPEIVATNVVVSPGGRRVLTVWSKVAQMWDVAGGRMLWESVHDQPIDHAAFSPDGSKVVTRYAGIVHVFDSETGRNPMPQIELFPDSLQSTASGHADFSADSSLVYGWYWDDRFVRCAVQLWNPATGQRVGTTMQHADGVMSVALSSDNQRVVTGGRDAKAILWDAMGRPLGPVLHHNGVVHGTAFGPDNRFVLTVSEDQTARLWTPDRGEPVTPSLWHFTPLKSGRFISGRKFLVRDADHKSWIREVSLDERPIDDLKTLCRFLSGGALPSEQAAFLNGRQLMELWKQLQAKHPAQFAVSEQEIVAWHEYQLEHCVREQDWFAAAFHLKHLHRLKPGDTSFAERLRVAQGKSQRK